MPDPYEIDARSAAQVAIIVCHGRSVTTGQPQVWIGDGPARRQVANPEQWLFSEGQELLMDRADAERLRALGFVYFADEMPPPASRPLGAVRAGQVTVTERQTPDGPTASDGDPPFGEDFITMTQTERAA